MSADCLLYNVTVQSSRYQHQWSMHAIHLDSQLSLVNAGDQWEYSIQVSKPNLTQHSRKKPNKNESSCSINNCTMESHTIIKLCWLISQKHHLYSTTAPSFSAVFLQHNTWHGLQLLPKKRNFLYPLPKLKLFRNYHSWVLVNLGQFMDKSMMLMM